MKANAIWRQKRETCSQTIGFRPFWVSGFSTAHNVKMAPALFDWAKVESLP